MSFTLFLIKRFFTFWVIEPLMFICILPIYLVMLCTVMPVLCLYDKWKAAKATVDTK